MPPKKQDKKAPAQAENDLSDLASLPHLVTLTMTTVTHFCMKKNEDAVKEGLKIALAEESVAGNPDMQHIKTFSREAIMEAAQGNHLLSIPQHSLSPFS